MQTSIFQTAMRLAIIATFIIHVQAAEVDNFTNRNAPLEDATVLLNKKANELIDEAIDSSNLRDSCNKMRLLNAVKKRFRNHYQDKFARYVYLGKDVPRRITKISESIYQDFRSFDSFILGFLGKVWDTNASVIKMGGHYLGTDKWEHFFGRGFVYYKMHVLEKKPLEETLNFGRISELGHLGLKTTGVFSYADLAANFKGMHFYNHLLGEGRNYLTFDHPMGPYISCIDGKWKRMTQIDLLPYVDDSWDEAINCSLFKNEKLLSKVKNRLEGLGQEFTCPISSERLEKLENYFGTYLPYVLNTKGHGVNP